MEQAFRLPALGPVIPEILMVSGALLILMLDLLIKRKETLAFLSLILTAVVLWSVPGSSGPAFGGMFLADGYSAFFKLIFLVSLFLSTLISVRYIRVEGVNFGEYYSLMLFSTLGMMLMAGAEDLIVLYLGLELMALSTYVLAGFLRHDIKSNEAALKYFLLGAFASGFLLFGISLTYGATGTTNIRDIAGYIAKAGLSGEPVLLLAVIFMAAAFSFKIAAVPFHMWAPDVYEGAPTSITAFMSVGPKAAGFAVIGKVFLVAFAAFKVNWTGILIPVSVATMAVGNILALVQMNIKRMLAYSSIAHAGYILLGIIAGGAEGMASVMSYLLIYAFMNIGAFAVVILLRTEGFKGDRIPDFEGLSKTHPLLAALMLLFMFSLTGIPPTAGFVGKFYLFVAAVNAGYTWLVVVAVIMSAISAYFYLRVVMYMYMREPKAAVSLETSPAISLALALSTAAVLLIGVLPGRVLELAGAAVMGGF